MRRSKHRAPRRGYGWLIGAIIIIGLVVGVAGRYVLKKKAAAQPTTTQVQHPLVAAKAEQALLADLPPDQFSGVAAIYHDGKRIATLTRGQADRRHHVKNTMTTMFEIDSVQKALTAGLVMREVNAGKLSLNTALSRYYPQVPGATKITLRQMLDMTSGLVYHGNLSGPTYTNDAVRIQQLITHLSFDTRAYNHGGYQPANYILLAGILEQVTHKRYQQLFTATYMKQLKLQHTRFAYANNHQNMASGYGWGPNGLRDAPLIKTSNAAKHQELGTGQIFMNVDDLYHAEHALLNGPLLSIQDSAWLFAPGSNSTYGGGLYQMPQYRLSNGFGYGYECFLRISQDGQDAVVVMANGSTPKLQLKNDADKLAQQWVH
ncbi:serine hydrolase domain-containing protein [Lacticaseibacillus sp. GG6-2]